MSPIAKNTLNIDLAESLALPLIIVVKDELGAINQALLTIKVAKQYQLDIACVVLNQFESNALANANAISHYGGCNVAIYNSSSITEFDQQLKKILSLS